MEEAAPGIMQDSPREKNKKLFDKGVWKPSCLMGGSIIIALALIYYISLTRGQGENDARTLIFTTLIISNLALIFLSNDSKLSFLQKIKLRFNKAVKVIAPLSLLMLALKLILQ